MNRFPNIVIGLPPVGLFAALMFLVTSLLSTGLLIVLSNTVAGIDVLRAIQKLLLATSLGVLVSHSSTLGEDGLCSAVVYLWPMGMTVVARDQCQK